MPTRRSDKLQLTPEEIARAFEGPDGPVVPAVLSPEGLARALGLSVKTIYEWIGKGRLDGSYKKRGKHVLFWRDKAIGLIFNGKEWTSE